VVEVGALGCVERHYAFHLAPRTFDDGEAKLIPAAQRVTHGRGVSLRRESGSMSSEPETAMENRGTASAAGPPVRRQRGVAPLSADVVPCRTTVAIAGVIVMVSALLFTFIAEDVLDGGGLVSHDEAVLAWFIDQRTDRMIGIARFVSAAGGFASLLVVALVTGLWLWRRGVHLLLAIAPLLSLLLASLASTVAKAAFDRERPPVTVHATTVTLAAFPSGHATDAAAFFLAGSLTLSLTVVHHRRSQIVLVAGGLVLAAAVGLSRLVLAVHWLSDVVAGWALGTAIGLTVGVMLWYTSACRARYRPVPDRRP
jgi:undecaprenyl-diphosphatase